MADIEIVQTHLVDIAWKDISCFFEKALQVADEECTLDQLKLLAMRGLVSVMVFFDKGNLIGACTIEFINYPNKRIAAISNYGGRGICNKETFLKMSEWCRSNGATQIRAYAGEAQTRLYRKVGLHKINNVLSYEVEL